jgi:hypothetical protein
MANYSQAQKTVPVNIKKTDENMIKCSMWNLQGINQFKWIQPI